MGGRSAAPGRDAGCCWAAVVAQRKRAFDAPVVAASPLLLELRSAAWASSATTARPATARRRRACSGVGVRERRAPSPVVHALDHVPPAPTKPGPRSWALALGRRRLWSRAWTTGRALCTALTRTPTPEQARRRRAVALSPARAARRAADERARRLGDDERGARRARRGGRQGAAATPGRRHGVSSRSGGSSPPTARRGARARHARRRHAQLGDRAAAPPGRPVRKRRGPCCRRSS